MMHSLKDVQRGPQHGLQEGFVIMSIAFLRITDPQMSGRLRGYESD